MTHAIENVYQINFKNHDLRNYIYRATHNLVTGLGKVKGTLRWVYYKTTLTEVLEKFSRLLKDFLRPRLHETRTKSNRDHFVSVIVLFIIDVQMRSGRK